MALYSTATGEGPAVVLVHGWGLSSAVWAGFAGALARRHRVIAVDLPGHGRSPGSRFELDEAADEVLELAPAGAHWIGWSLGGLVALKAAARAPGRLGGAMLLASTPRFVRGAGWPGLEPGVLVQFAADLSQDYQRTIGRFLFLVSRGAPAQSEALRALRRQLGSAPAPDRAALADGLKVLRDTDLRDRLEGLAVPLSLVLGARDMLVPVAMAEVLHRRMAHLPVTVIDAAGHAPFLSHPDPCLKAVEQFVT